MATQEWSIQEIARVAGTTSRTLRHYDDVGLLAPSRIGSNGYRYYDQHCLVQLQRILLLRELGLGLPAIADVLDGERDSAAALAVHLEWLRQERDRIDRQIASVTTTLRKLEGGEQIMATEALDGFDHTQYKDEVIERWGKDAWERGDDWWRSLSDEDKHEFKQRQHDIAGDFTQALKDGKSADSDDVQAIVQRQYDWIAVGWQGKRPTADEFVGLGQMYVDDPRFRANYDRHGEGTAAFIRDAMVAYAERVLR
ncbi:MAG: MerR family transcriptional regulator [Actinophytocola sp.]|nr:MerR family transcriptional regulator [Actinophytocola sp.]